MERVAFGERLSDLRRMPLVAHALGVLEQIQQAI